MKRSPLQRKTPLAPSSTPLRTSRLAPIGKRGKQRNAASRKATEERAETVERCEFPHRELFTADGVYVECTGHHGLDPHHVELRSAATSLIGAASNLRLICRRSHDWIHGHPAHARRMGLYGPKEAA